MVDDAQSARPHRVDGREVEPKRAVPRDVLKPFKFTSLKSSLFTCYFKTYS